ncbi:MAG: glycosyltransferase [Intestinibacter bartlettii]|uniref:glycosyltransferase n=1 Tax=Intestinibacter bartlettii TaxID=261299 RepID=UPI00290715EB|nr:glycosyltransferase [Intestinibacter bartlettii]MDU6198524.1 glycosyltransferase [Intestinibacter bartlettii]
MKKILFVCYGLGIGGIERCLVNLINELDSNLYDIDLLLLNPEYNLLDEITNKVTLLDTFKYSMNTENTYNHYKQDKNILKKVNNISKYIIFRLINKYGQRPWKIFNKVEKTYDIAVSYSQNGLTPYYVIDKVNATRKYLWYHNGDYERTGKKYKLDLEYYSKFDNLVAVSTDCKKRLSQYFGNIQDKIIVMNNIVDTERIINLANSEQAIEIDKDSFSILTVGRLTKEKGAELAVNVCKKLVDNGFNIKWYWVGDGNQAYYIKELTNKLGLEDVFYLLGNKNNPYVYMKQCDLYVQPSKYEAYCTTTNEARILNKPVVTTDVGGMKEQFIDKKTALIVKADIESLYKSIALLIDNKDYREKIVLNLKHKNFEFKDYINDYNRLFLVEKKYE